MLTGAVRDSPVGGLIVRVHYLVIFVRFLVVLSHGAYLLTCHDVYRAVTGELHTRLTYGEDAIW